MILTIKKTQDAFVNRVTNTALRELDDFFLLRNRKWEPTIVLVSDRQAVDALHGYKTGANLIAWVDAKKFTVFLLDRRHFSKQSSWPYSKQSYACSIKHELIHLFVYHYKQSKWPYIHPWLNEGLAVYLSGGLKFLDLPKELRNFAAPKAPPPLWYRDGGLAVQFLLETYGRRKLLRLLRDCKVGVESSAKFLRCFENIYGFKLCFKNFRILR